MDQCTGLCSDSSSHVVYSKRQSSHPAMIKAVVSKSTESEQAGSTLFLLQRTASGASSSILKRSDLAGTFFRGRLWIPCSSSLRAKFSHLSAVLFSEAYVHTNICIHTLRIYGSNHLVADRKYFNLKVLMLNINSPSDGGK